MKIVFTGGGSGGHFYPLMAIAEAVRDQIKEQNVLDVKLYYLADKPYDERALFVNELEFVAVPTGKLRLYFSPKNIVDIFKTGAAVFKALLKMVAIYPDVVISKGGYPAFPVVTAAWLLRIPVVMHESDMVAGRVNQITAKFAKRIGVSFPDAVNIFNKRDITAWTGQPIRKSLWEVSGQGFEDFFGVRNDAPVIVVYGGSQGAGIINDALMEILSEAVNDFYIIHQTGVSNLEEIKSRAKFLLEENPFKERYKPYGFFDERMLEMLGAKADLFITRGGAGSIFDMAMWEMPAIIIPITHSNGDHQRKNSYEYAATGAAHVIEEKNLEPHVFLSEIRRLFEDRAALKEMEFFILEE
jgi:UDP-N-acetylglucosamine--N-acetylmuramyl-(pentapeptide) pyrophosphoryl-undecaprenol N-acetylglucosamine transferase